MILEPTLTREQLLNRELKKILSENSGIWAHNDVRVSLIRRAFREAGYTTYAGFLGQLSVKYPDLTEPQVDFFKNLERDEDVYA